MKSRMKRIAVIILWIGLAGCAFGENFTSDILLMKVDSLGNLVWRKTWDVDSTGEVTKSVVTRDGGYAVLGETWGGEGHDSIFLLKADDNGNILWCRRFGFNEIKACQCSSRHSISRRRADYINPLDFQETSDGGYAVVGRASKLSRWDILDKNYVWFTKTDEEGRLLHGWIEHPRDFGAELRNVIEVDDDSYVLIGDCDYKCWITKRTGCGECIWNKFYGKERFLILWSKAVKSMDGGFIIACNADTLDLFFGSDYTWLLKTDPDGDTLWTRTLPGFQPNYLHQTSDGGSFIGSRWGYPDALIKIDSSGNTIWKRPYSYSAWGGLIPTADGGYSIMKWALYSGGDMIFLTRTNAVGDTLWRQYYENVRGVSLQQAPDGGYFIAGLTNVIHK
ncbi:hypothetical protein JXM67_11290 [candidate division WOR-3 bacterium]|nr:hypothetical protein [candidate division WOR-3 bacterium]